MVAQPVVRPSAMCKHRVSDFCERSVMGRVYKITTGGWHGGATVGCRTCDQELASSIPAWHGCVLYDHGRPHIGANGVS